MARDICGVIYRYGLVVSLQNGLGNIETLARIFGAERSLGANVPVGAIIPEAGRVTVTVQAAPIIIGPLEVSDCVMLERIHYWIKAFQRANIPCEHTVRIPSYLWAKIFYNAPLNALGALLQVQYGVLAEVAELWIGSSTSPSSWPKQMGSSSCGTVWRTIARCSIVTSFLPRTITKARCC